MVTRKSRGVLLLDEDGPLAGFDDQFYERCIAEGWTFDIDGPPFQTERYLTQHLPNRRERRLAEKMIDSPGWFASLPVVAGAQEGVAALLDAGVDVWVCTKPKESNPTCHSDKYAWTARHFPDLAKRLIITPDKSLVYGDVLLDDAPKHAWFGRAFWTPVIFDSPFNRSGSDWGHLPRFDWSQPVDVLLELIENHRAAQRSTSAGSSWNTTCSVCGRKLRKDPEGWTHVNDRGQRFLPGDEHPGIPA